MKDVQEDTKKSYKYPDTPLALFFAEKCLEAAVEEGAHIATLVKKEDE